MQRLCLHTTIISVDITHRFVSPVCKEFPSTRAPATQPTVSAHAYSLPYMTSAPGSGHLCCEKMRIASSAYQTQTTQYLLRCRYRRQCKLSQVLSRGTALAICRRNYAYLTSIRGAQGVLTFTEPASYCSWSWAALVCR